MLKIIISLLLIQAAFSTCQDCQIDCSSKKTNGMLVESADGDIYKIFCGTDLYGNDIDNVGDLDLVGCIELCSNTDNCVSVSYKDSLNRCYLKSATSEGTSNEDTVGAALVSSIYVPAFEEDCSDSDDDGNIVTDRNGVYYKLYCNTNFGGGDLTGFPDLSFEECVTKCDTTENCQSVTYTGHCYLKSSNETQKVKGQHSALKLHSCGLKWDTVNQACFSSCVSPLVEADSEAGTKICNAPCYQELFWDVSNEKCVIECNDDQVESSEGGVKICQNKQYGCKLSSLVQKQRAMMRRNFKK